jgi:hypothetical protein
MRQRHRSIRRRTGILAFAAAFSALLLAPQVSSAGLIDDVVNLITGGGATPTQTPGQGGYQPPLHGTNPHGQGTVGVIDLTPSDQRPLPGDPSGANPDDTQPLAGEDIVVGRARGEQNGDAYHGHVTVLALLGNELIGTDSDEGETVAGPLDPIQTAVLDAICNGSGICLTVLAADTSTTSTGSTNHFEVLDAAIADPILGTPGITASAAESNGNISDDGTCQTAHGDSTVASANVGGAITAGVADSSSDSTACNDGTPSSTTTDGNVINLMGMGIPIPAAGCDNTPNPGTPNVAFTALSPLLSTVCNAQDINGLPGPIQQVADEYGVREALSLFVIEAGGTALVKATTAASESVAVAPAAPGPVCPDPNNPECPNGGPPDDDGPGGPAGPVAQETNEPLPFTGSQVALLGLIGAAMLGTGLLVRGLAARRRYH